MIRVLKGAELALQKNIFPVLDRLVQVGGDIADVGLHHVAVLKHGLIQLPGIQKRLVIEVLQKHIFRLADADQLFF